MRRGIRHSGKSFRSHDETTRTFQCESSSADTYSTKNLRKIKHLESKSRGIHNLLKEGPKEGQEAARMHSPGPTPHPVDAKVPLRKFYKLYTKIVIQLETVKGFSESKRNESENLVDLRRQLQRADEFSIRFSRNNLYETKRMINEIKQLIAPYSFETLPPGHTRLLFRKIILAYQAASQALQSYINYAKNPSNLEVPHKINELVLLIADLFLCCEQVSLPINDTSLKNDAVRVCNELIKILKSKVPVCEYVEIKDADLAKNKTKKVPEEGQKVKKLSMYKTKLTPKLKNEVLRKKHGITCLLGAKGRKSKRDEKKAKITHEIYTQKLNNWQGRGQGSKFVKFDPDNPDRVGDNADDQKARKYRHMTPREVRSQDDDVVTMVQAIADDETSVCRLSSTTRDNEEEGDQMNHSSFKDLLLEAIEGLRSSDKKEQKITLKKLLSSIESCSKIPTEPPPPPPPPLPPPTPAPERVKVFHFISTIPENPQPSGKEDEVEEEEEEEGECEVEPQPPPARMPSVEPEKEKVSEEKAPEVVPAERKLKMIFKPLLARRDDKADDNEANGRVKLKLSEDTMTNANKYRKAFSEYRKNNIMYKKTLANKPWKLVGRVSDHIILDIIKEISLDFENDAILRRLYLSELQEVTS